MNSTSDTYYGDQWVTAELVVYHDSLVKHIINGKTVLEYTKPQIGGGVAKGYDPKMKQDGKLLTEGFIALQSEGQPIDFRAIKIRNLKGCTDPKANNFKAYYQVSDKEACTY
ncbi:DUF1080 domain-containing protein [Maribacter sp.]|uniref:3-keto-disaccharide hydrolase n=1 Tax=Maribacter sp. TaxID=1897614 RepID=UPI003299694E